ncbi:MAG: hypothetical protein CM15mV63_130 [uncultured marine virus]|nr:MAG: hypothetical protein CM15mV63_130 [uncultured marine virus]
MLLKGNKIRKSNAKIQQSGLPGVGTDEFYGGPLSSLLKVVTTQVQWNQYLKRLHSNTDQN